MVSSAVWARETMFTVHMVTAAVVVLVLVYKYSMLVHKYKILKMFLDVLRHV